MNMPCGNTAALRQFERDQARRDACEPSPEQVERFIENWIEGKAKILGTEFVTEALGEADTADQMRLFWAFQTDDEREIGAAVKKMVNRYWSKPAREAADAYDFSQQDD